MPSNWIAWALDEADTAIDCLPLGTALRPGEGSEKARFDVAEHPSPDGATHAARSVAHAEDEIRAVAERAGWRAVRCERGPFGVVEVRVEKAVRLESLTPQMAADYLAAVRPA